MDLGTQRICHYGHPKLKLLTFPVPYLSQADHLPGSLHQGHPDWPVPAEHPHGYGRPTGTDPAKSLYQKTSLPLLRGEGTDQDGSDSCP